MARHKQACQTCKLPFKIFRVPTNFFPVNLRWSEAKTLKFLKLFLLPLDSTKTLYNHRTWKYIAKTEVKIFVTVIVSMVTV